MISTGMAFDYMCADHGTCPLTDINRFEILGIYTNQISRYASEYSRIDLQNQTGPDCIMCHYSNKDKVRKIFNTSIWD